MHRQKQQIISAITTRMEKDVEPAQLVLARAFVEQFHGSLSLDDLLLYSEDELYGTALAQWNFCYQRKPGETKVKVYNPNREEDGWHSKGTIVQISHDDMPFLVDSTRMEINRQGYSVHLIIHFGGMRLRRDDSGKITEVLPLATELDDDMAPEAPIFLQINRQTDSEVLESLEQGLCNILADVRASVEDWQKMRERVGSALVEIEQSTFHLQDDEVAESKDFLRWIDDHFTFLGCRDYQLVGQGDEQALEIVPGTGLGVLRESKHGNLRTISSLTDEARALLFSSQLLIISKTNTRATIHRPVYTDYIGVKRFNKNGEVVGELRMVGLYTSLSYNTNPMQIPFLRRKVATVMCNSGLPQKGHAAKALLNVLETLPRDDLFQATADELLPLAMGIFNIQERQTTRFFMRKDIYGRFISCLIYVPRERFNTLLRKSFQRYLMERFKGLEVNFSTRFSDSVLARIHFVLRIDPTQAVEYNSKDIELDLVKLARSWLDELKDVLYHHYDDEQGEKIFESYSNAFRSSYREDFSAAEALADIIAMEKLDENNLLEMRFYPSSDANESTYEFKLLHLKQIMPISDVVPILENMGLRVLSESPYRMVRDENDLVWIDRLIVEHNDDTEFDVVATKEIFKETFSRTWKAQVENDGFNRLVLAAHLNWREISVLRAYTKYLRQIGFTFSQKYIEETLAKNSITVKLLIDLFIQRLDPSIQQEEQRIKDIIDMIVEELDTVAILDEDRILRRLLDVINATLRTNYFQTDLNGDAKTYISFKMDPQVIPEMPLPLPMYEIFVYSPRFEGVHLRSAKVARGGLRWSDRREDFRTEILGLMKAQVVKNAVIVPSGAKGGFVAKCLPDESSRDVIMAEVVDCYRNFIRGLLDLTDNIKHGEIVYPAQVKRYDGDDPYLVVAADKGTATFSDTANAIAKEYDFWLDDAFASGGSVGYDHKKMGITARGAWVSVARHFRELDLNTQTTDFTVVGIGDMAGDVFGNGMLLSPHIKLVAAFNHMHIFIDPDPDTEKSYQERLRLFNTPRVTWAEYDEKLLSSGGGIYTRASKSIKLSKQAQALLGVQQNLIVPNELIRIILKAQVDLLWNGGIGTYVKAKNERHIDVGDRANDVTRINADELRCRVVGEGGNLGLTQLGRIEYALRGGKINTDAIDNSAGVDCSDHEVNIKILLNEVVQNKKMTQEERNQCLAEMTDDVAKLVLHNNYMQTLAISVADSRALSYLDLFSHYIRTQEQAGRLNRELEFLPSEEELLSRKAEGKSLTRPEISVLLAYSKSILKDEILASDLPEEPYLAKIVMRAFPHALREKFNAEISNHRLKRDIVATELSNIIINEVGINFTQRLHTETGSSIAAIVRSYTIVRELFDLPDVWTEIKSLDYQISSALQHEMLVESIRFTRRATRWFLRNNRSGFAIEELIQRFATGLTTVMPVITNLARGTDLSEVLEKKELYTQQNVPEAIAAKVAKMSLLFSAIDIVQTAGRYKLDLMVVGEAYFALGDHLKLGWLRQAITSLNLDDRWDSLMRETLRDDLDWQQHALTVAILTKETGNGSIEDKLSIWLARHQGLIVRWQCMLDRLRSHTSPTFIIYAVALRELLDLAQASAHYMSKKE